MLIYDQLRSAVREEMSSAILDETYMTSDGVDFKAMIDELYALLNDNSDLDTSIPLELFNEVVDEAVKEYEQTGTISE